MMKTDKKWIGTSWKMNKTLAQALEYARALEASNEIDDISIQRFVIPAFTVAREVKATLAQSSVLVGAQNMHWEDAGAWTGEVSPPMLVDCGLDIVELGHSERRAHFGETDATVGLKTAAAIRHGLIPLICVGETYAERDAGRASNRLQEQVQSALKYIETHQKMRPLLFAYEPVWAIGEKGTPASPDYADRRHLEIAEVAQDILGVPVPCLYGGSVNVENCTDLIREPSIDGLFIGRAAWNVDGYRDIIKRCVAVMKKEREGP